GAVHTQSWAAFGRGPVNISGAAWSGCAARSTVEEAAHPVPIYLCVGLFSRFCFRPYARDFALSRESRQLQPGML
ncbi:MAG: hypothetical protein J0H30_09510, partial [Alphaproteobacteria bacterium]|nr:hypothetical protein [Alphaproteobacteria bacterium]